MPLEASVHMLHYRILEDITAVIRFLRSFQKFAWATCYIILQLMIGIWRRPEDQNVSLSYTSISFSSIAG